METFREVLERCAAVARKALAERGIAEPTYLEFENELLDNTPYLTMLREMENP